jgi:hypothetical protein
LNNVYVEIENRKILYYKKYQYRAKFAIPGLYHLWHAKDITDLDKVIHKQMVFAQQNLRVGAGTYGLDLMHNREILAALLIWIDKYKDDTCIRMEGNNCSVFSNDLSILKTLNESVADLISATKNFKVHINYTKAQLYGSPETIDLLNPKHNYRVYFRNKSIRGTNFVKDLEDFLDIHKNTVFPSKALYKWVKDFPYEPPWKYTWLSASHFIEYDNESTNTLLSLFLDGYLAKTYKVVQRES